MIECKGRREVNMDKMRIERDSLGEKKIPSSAYYGIQTYRAVENFPISGLRARHPFIQATAYIKKAAAMANTELGLIPREIGQAIAQAADEIIEGKHEDQFVVDIFQAGAGTSHNMNLNEVIANRVIEVLGGKRGDYSVCHPNDDVNRSQSTNDVYPTAIRIAALLVVGDLLDSVKQLAGAFTGKGKEFERMIKSGRTHLQDATPVTLGQEFGAYADCLEHHARYITDAADSLRELGIGGTAVGTGLNSHPRYRELVVEHLRTMTGLDLVPGPNLFESMQSMRPVVHFSSSLRDLAIDLGRIANDIRLLSSGPLTGLGEITLPAVQPGSSIMPGKVNPVMAEMLNMVCYEVIGNDLTISQASLAGQLELNVMMPVISHNLLFSMEILTNAVREFSERCVRGIEADRAKCLSYVERSLALVTALSPHIGYLKAAELAKEVLATGKPLREVALERGILDEKSIDAILDIDAMTKPGIPGKAESTE
jgi:aspartate ammonia-lyase